MSVKGGYHILNLQNKDLQYSPTIPGAYESVEGSYQKPILLSGIVIGGVEKADVYRMPVVSGSSYIFENVYGYDLTLTDSDGLSLASTQWATRSYVDNKKFYVHPVSVKSKASATDIFYLSFLVLTDDGEAFTASTFKSYLTAHGTARFIVTGAYKTSSYYFSPAYVYYNPDVPSLAVVGIDNQGTEHGSLTNVIDFEAILDDSENVFYDGVNSVSLE